MGTDQSMKETDQSMTRTSSTKEDNQKGGQVRLKF
jgi:hypothetical protein